MRWLVLLTPLFLLAACSPAGKGAPGPDLGVILAEDPARSLSDYGLFADMASAAPAQGVLPYDLINPLFTDHAAKHRFVFVPGGARAAYKESDVFDFPVGSVLVKTFAFAPDMRAPEEGQWRVETRLLIHKAGGWVAYPYIWNEAQTEAVYSPAGKRIGIEIISPDGAPLELRYAVPNQNQCKTCHQAGKDIAPIGPKARHLAYEDQLARWAAAGILSGLPEEVTGEPSAFDPSAPLDLRARAWLDVNCAHCHKADGSASNSGLWLSSTETGPARIGILKHPVAAGRGSGGLKQVIVPGDPDASILLYRMASTEPGVAMPELGRSVTDPHSLALIREWIAAMETE
ncbi:SO2930 family diheme c-type cytochrome [Hyphomonas sp. NPDC076900]|uniref:SO2930 family diheme c-type cytochrome n=1 Tax=unclassified Hyphomonas TaxID=2630699 RepID=UPI003D03CE01